MVLEPPCELEIRAKPPDAMDALAEEPPAEELAVADSWLPCAPFAAVPPVIDWPPLPVKLDVELSSEHDSRNIGAMRYNSTVHREANADTHACQTIENAPSVGRVD